MVEAAYNSGLNGQSILGLLVNGAGLTTLCPALCHYFQSSGIIVIFKNKHLPFLAAHSFSTV